MIMNEAHKVQLLLGGNLGDRAKYLAKANLQLSTTIGTVVYKSAIYESEPWGFDDENQFLNQLVIVQTALSPTEVLSKIKLIEADLGRAESELQWSSRIIDIDILFYEESIVKEKNLIIPHPRIHERRFVLEPLLESDPGFIHPLTNKTVRELYSQCTDQSEVVIYAER
ncbi:MAG TPA: 2-amino-4-hydroxy-6-hydroxymethyldihydropteridine diphosphokinase [Flavobacteriales bacterium]|nr:2-amino-4-hydroxy-6-hydroxymethyldihydropteridine diphosphokinase [Flavobacteriales bacterium]HIA11559.1 2-amino-4-hydroxy-6-hydroxymethyldihydropteridine diphosphokinase [Flavobacteriales bacterium]HIO72411.1 2-amino-4-hydroxy-6-hydroxymethyldihydropteridine diphosphokinase [Flavobacteriales bacterium]